MKTWRTVPEAATRAQVHPATVRRAIHSRYLPPVRVNGGRSIRIRDDWIDAWLERFETAPVVPSRPMPGVAHHG